MKSTFFTLGLILVHFSVFSQEALEYDTLKFEQTTLPEYYLNTKQGAKVNFYQTKKGELIKIGDTLKIGMPKNTLSSDFLFIYAGKMKGANKFLLGNNSIRLKTNWSGREFVIHEILTGHLGGGRKQPLGIYLYLGNPDGSDIMKNLISILITDFEGAFEQGEILTNKFSMSRNDAVKKLKEAKDLLDLNVIKNEDYEKIRSKLILIINNE